MKTKYCQFGIEKQAISATTAHFWIFVSGLDWRAILQKVAGIGNQRLKTFTLML
jgi:hypothetical protein